MLPELPGTIAGWTQNEIAEKLGLNRARVIGVLNVSQSVRPGNHTCARC